MILRSSSNRGAGAAVLPPKLHWAYIVALAIVTGGLFWFAWLLVQATWIRKVRPQSNALLWLVGSLAAALVTLVAEEGPMMGFLNAAFLLLYFVGIFGMRRDIEEHFTAEGLKLNGVMTLLSSAAYFQYHLRPSSNPPTSRKRETC